MKRNGVRKFVFGLALMSFASATIAFGVFLWTALSFGIGHVASASLFAITLFLACCGVVLYYVSQPPRPANTDQQGGQAAEERPTGQGAES